MATFGYTTLGSGSYEEADYMFGSKYALSETGVVSKLTVGIGDGLRSSDVKCAIYDSSFNLLATTQEVNVPIQAKDWVDFPFASPPTLSAGNYWLVVISKSIINKWNDAGDPNQGFYESQSYATAFPASFAPDVYENKKWSIYATDTPKAKTPLKWTPHSAI